MKNRSILVAATVMGTVWIMAAASALARGADAPRDTMVTVDNLSRLSVGGGAERLSLEIEAPGGGGTGTLDARNYFGFIGLDILRWLTLSGGAGQVEAKSGSGSSYGDGDTSWMAGATVSLLAHPVTAPGYFEGTLRIDARYAHWDFESAQDRDSIQWTEDRAAVVVSMEFPVGHAMEARDNIPFSSVLSIGPVYSAVDGEAAGGVEFEEADSVGMLLGFDIKFAPNWSAGWLGRWIGDEVSHTFAAAFHF